MSDRFENSWQNHSVEYIDNQISENKLEFVVINDPELDFELVQEAWMNEKYLVAVAHKIDGEWRVTFIPDGELPTILASFGRNLSIFLKVCQ